ncbi:MAG TPA: P-loop NTPase [Polyangia bacterium]|nr:P-loop NTPase [Polyangia bacterium]
MSDRQSRSARPSRLSSAAPRPVVRVRMLSTGRWRPPLGQTPLTGRRAPRLIAVGAALPGVGKSVVASNLAVAIAGLGRQVVVVDLDLGTPRQHTLFGVEAATNIERPTGVRNVRLWPAATLLERARDASARRALIEGLGQLDADVVIVDVADAHRDDLWNGFATGAERLLVSTGDRGALEATYAFLQEAVVRAERRHGARAREVLARFTGGLVGNVAAAAEEAESFHAFARLVRGELGIPLTTLGCLRQSARIIQSIAAKKPLCARRGIDDEVRAFNQIAELVVAERDDAAPDCALDGDAPALEPARLPTDLGRYQRRFPRFAVDWAATFEIAGEPNAVRVRDVSESGAAVESTLALRVGDAGMLHFYQLDDRLSVEVVVKNVVPSLNRVGFGFVRAGAAAARIVAAARARLITP